MEKSEKLHNLDPKTVWLLFLSYNIRLLFYIPFVFGAAFVFTMLKLSTDNYPGSSNDIIKYITAIPGSVLLIYLIFQIGLSYLIAYLTYINWKYGLTADALRIEKGIIWKKYVSVPYERIQNVDILRGILARLLGLSDIYIQTAGQSMGPAFSPFSEGRLPGLDHVIAENFRDELIRKAKGKQGV